MLFKYLLCLNDPEPHHAPVNMAIDEVLLAMVGEPTLRCYRWKGPALSLGYFIKFDEVATEPPQRELVRRWTGGGIVSHGDGEDFTYSLLVPRTHPFALRPSLESYEAVHQCVAAALKSSSGGSPSLASSRAPKLSEACFANPAQYDVMLGGRKIAGAAQRRTAKGLLHQGSIQSRALRGDFGTALAAALAETTAPAELEPLVLEAAKELAARKYGTESWLRRF